MEITQLPVANSIDGVNDTFPIVTNSLNSTQQISRNTFLGLSSAPVGLTDTQSLTNKTLTSPTISSPTFSGTTAGTFTLGGSITFPSSVVQLTSTQTLTNKTLTSPTINSPNITNATLSSDTITGYTTSNSGTLFGSLTATTGNLSTSGTFSSGAITSSGIIKASTSNPVWQYLGRAQITSSITGLSSTTNAALTGLSVTVTIPTGVTLVRIKVYARDVTQSTSTTPDYMNVTIWSGAVGSGTALGAAQVSASSTGGNTLMCLAEHTPSAGSITYNAGYIVGNGSDSHSVEAGTTFPAFIEVECC